MALSKNVKKHAIERAHLTATATAAVGQCDNSTRRTAPWPTSGCPDTVLAFPCKEGYGCCVSARLRLVVASCFTDCLLYVYCLDTGALLRTLGNGYGSAHDRLNFLYGSVCFGPCGDTVMVADECNNRVSELSVMDGAIVSLHGNGVLKRPRYIDCNTETGTLVVSCYVSCAVDCIQLVQLRTGYISTVNIHPALVYLPKPYFYGSDGVIVVGERGERFSSRKWVIQSVTPGSAAATAYESSVYKRSKQAFAGIDVLPFCGSRGEMQCIVSDFATRTVGLFGDCEKDVWKECGFIPGAVVALQDDSGTVVVRGYEGIRVLRNRELRFTWLAVVVLASCFQT